MVELQMFLRFHLAPCFFVIFSIQKLKKMWTVNPASRRCKSEWKLNLTRRLQKQSDNWQRVGEGIFFLIALQSLLSKLSLSNYIFVPFVLFSSDLFHLSDVRFFYNKFDIWQGGCGDTRTSDKVWERAFSLLSHCTRYNFYFSSELLSISLSNYVAIIFTF